MTVIKQVGIDDPLPPFANCCLLKNKQKIALIICVLISSVFIKSAETGALIRACNHGPALAGIPSLAARAAAFVTCDVSKEIRW
jgi:hypothetical protein